ncbi:MAG: hypothetical protein GY696_24325 [Gammaproteobacteria bacterium]|nr:hypothetical protein [Gammaproteobacteria bacterium]
MESALKLLPGGTLYLTFKEAKLFRDTEWLGKMDPFCSLEYGKGCKKQRTRTHNGGGKNPIWNDTLSIIPTSFSDEIQVVVYDEDTTSDDKIGSCMIKISGLVINSGIQDWFHIHHNGKQAG